MNRRVDKSIGRGILRKTKSEAVNAFKPCSSPKLCQKTLLEQQVKLAKTCEEGKSTLPNDSKSHKRTGQREESVQAVTTIKSKP